MSIVAAMVASTVVGQTSARMTSSLQRDLRDLKFTMKIGKSNISELKKINNDFANSYRFKESEVMMKEPFQLKMVSIVGETRVVLVLNKTQQLMKVPGKIQQKTDLSKAPGRRQTFFDFGILTPSLFDNYMEAKFIRVDRRTNQPVFDVTYVASLGDETRHRIWVDDKKGVVTKREWYSQIDKRLMATFNYSGFVQSDGVWVPSKMEVYNSENKFAGSTSYSNIRANTGISSNEFNF